MHFFGFRFYGCGVIGNIDVTHANDAVYDDNKSKGKCVIQFNGKLSQIRKIATRIFSDPFTEFCYLFDYLITIGARLQDDRDLNSTEYYILQNT